MANWFYLTAGQQHGPVEPAALKQLATSGQLKPTDKVRREDLQKWYEAKQVKGLFAQTFQVAANQNPANSSTSQSKPVIAKRVSSKPAIVGHATQDIGVATTTARTESENANARKVKQGSPAKKEPASKGTLLGCGGVLGLAAVIAVVSYIMDIGTTVENGTVKWSMTIDGVSLKVNAWKIAGEVYDKARRYPKASKAEITVSLHVPGGISDKYGNAQDNPCLMGVLPVDDLNEVRKYRSSNTYSYNESNTEFYKAMLRSMQCGNLLE